MKRLLIFVFALVPFLGCKKDKEVQIIAYYPFIPSEYFNPQVPSPNDYVYIHNYSHFPNSNDTLIYIRDSILYGRSDKFNWDESQMLRIVFEVPFKYVHSNDSYYQLRPEVLVTVDGTQYILQAFDSACLMREDVKSVNRLPDWFIP